jgi:hypothetical protein
MLCEREKKRKKVFYMHKTTKKVKRLNYSHKVYFKVLLEKYQIETVFIQ